MSIFLRNWHLKLGAVFLATVLYTGLVFSGSFTEQVVSGVPIEMVGQPDDWVPLTQLETVEVRYRVAADSAQRLRWIRTGQSRGSSVDVLSGLLPGDLVALDASKARDGQRARPLVPPEGE